MSKPSSIVQAVQETRAIDPNVLQRRASDPDCNVWVNASAGTGKTKVLTDRILRLLLPKADGRAGCEAHKILCVTFTKAGASEMLLRLQKTLGRWAMIDPQTLAQELTQLLGQSPSAEQMGAAGKLFGQIVDLTGGFKIMTIHAFCQSLLARFPLEANVSTHLQAMDETEAARLQAQAIESVFVLTQREGNTEFAQIIRQIAGVLSKDDFDALMGEMINERDKMSALLKEHFGVEGFYHHLCTHYGFAPEMRALDILKAGCEDQAFDVDAMRQLYHAFEKLGGKTEQKKLPVLADFLAADVENRVAQFDAYAQLFLRKDYTILAKLANKAIMEKEPALYEALVQEADRVYALRQRYLQLQLCGWTRDILYLGQMVCERYEALKQSTGKLDYHDMILKAMRLLEDSSRWVLYKLDQGIDHVMVDEAQDTNPEQWRIVRALCDDFLDQPYDPGHDRSLFVVGDEKQSIYRFQRASPEQFLQTHQFLKQKAEAQQHPWNDVNLNISFRSTAAVLKVVDQTFAFDAAQKAISQSAVEHRSFRSGQAGVVELWPELCDEELPDIPLWEPLAQPISFESAQSRLAKNIAERIAGWIGNQEVLESYGRPIKPGDIMILVRRRSSLMAAILRALKEKSIPVAGADRSVLSDHIAVQDLLAFAQFLLLPDDDLNLACLLKSPLFGLSEDMLFELAYGRTGSLWQRVSEHESMVDVCAYLKSMLKLSRFVRPYELFHRILILPCPAHEKSGLVAMKNRLGADVQEIFDEFLSEALAFEDRHIADLQLFYEAMMQGGPVIKREMDGEENLVRLMTVHGAKGLQAPIVILPDSFLSKTLGQNSASKNFIWPDQGGMAYPLFSPKREYHSDIYLQAASQIRRKDYDEYLRLLYVAMTRAEERLYVCGAYAKNKPSDQSWYYAIQAGMEALDAVETLDDGSLRFYLPQTKDPDKADVVDFEDQLDIEVPDWYSKPPADEPKSEKIYAPSRLDAAEDERWVQPQALGYNPLLRGNIIHKLLELLPVLKTEQYHAMASLYVERYGRGLPQDVRVQIVDEVLAVLSDKNYQGFFDQSGQSEVSISGRMHDGRLISGQIDRLVVREDSVWILDYKSGMIPPEPDKIPTAYVAQLQAYADIIGQLYPDKACYGALLWTAGPVLMPVIVPDA